MDHNEVFHGETKAPHSNTIDNSSLLESTTKTINFKVQIHCVKLECDGTLEPFNYLASHKDRIIGFVNNLFQETTHVKPGITISVKLVKPFESEVTEVFLNSSMSRIACAFTDDEYHEHVDALMSQMNVFATEGSGSVVQSLKRLEIKTVSCSNVTAASHIETPALLKLLTPTLLNTVNKRDNFCFLNCKAAALFSFAGKATNPKSHRKTSSGYISVRNQCRCL